MRQGFLAFVLVSALLPVGSADAVVDTLVITHVGGGADHNLDYLPGSDNLSAPAILPVGGTLQYRNLNTGLPHDLISTICIRLIAEGLYPRFESEEVINIGGSCPSGGHRLFASEVVGYNQQSAVRDSKILGPGEYRFYCSVHGAPMQGNLKVVGP